MRTDRRALDDRAGPRSRPATRRTLTVGKCSQASRAAASVTGVRSPLQSPRLRRILAAYTINRLGTWFGLVASAARCVRPHAQRACGRGAALRRARSTRVRGSRCGCPGRGVTAPQRAERAVLLRGARHRRACHLAVEVSRCRRCCCWRRSTEPPRSRRSALLRAELARGARDFAEAEMGLIPGAGGGDGTEHLMSPCRSRYTRPSARRNAALQRRLLGHVRARTGARRRWWSQPRAHPLRCSSTSARSCCAARC